MDKKPTKSIKIDEHKQWNYIPYNWPAGSWMNTASCLYVLYLEYVTKGHSNAYCLFKTAFFLWFLSGTTTFY